MHSQLPFIQKRWWAIQALLLLSTGILLQWMDSSFGIRRCLGIAAPLFAVLILPELWKNRSYEATEVTTNESFFSPLLAAIEKMTDFVSARNSSQEMEMGMFRISIPEFDPRAVREAIVNAFAHRDYTQLGRVLVRIDADGFTVSNPGGFIEGVTYQNILTVEPHGRNPVLADALKRVGLAERSGRGVDRIFEGSLIYGRDLPDYSESTSTNVKLFIPRGAPDKHIVSLISEEQKRMGHRFL